MLNKKHATKILIAMLVSLSVLFGGFFLYQNFNVKQPIEHSLDTISGVKIKEISVDKQTVNIDVTLNQINNLQQTYEQIVENIDPLLKGRDLNLSFISKADDKLTDAWNQSYFNIAEAIETQHYSLIPKTVESIKENYHLDKARYSMSDTNIFVDLHKGNQSVYIVMSKTKSGGE